MNNIKRISLMTAIFLTVALVSSSVEAGVIRINGYNRRERKWRTFSRSGRRVLCQWEPHVNRHAAWSIHNVLFGHSGLCFQRHATRRPGASSLVVGDAANGDSILTYFFGNNVGLCDNGDLHLVNPVTIIGGTGRYAGARGSLTLDGCSNLATGETSGTISGTIVVRGR